MRRRPERVPADGHVPGNVPIAANHDGDHCGDNTPKVPRHHRLDHLPLWEDRDLTTYLRARCHNQKPGSYCRLLVADSKNAISPQRLALSEQDVPTRCFLADC